MSDDPSVPELSEKNYADLSETLAQAQQDMQTMYIVKLEMTRYDAKMMVQAYEDAAAGDLVAMAQLWQELITVIQILEQQIAEDDEY
jgi:hypothetical protein